MNSWRTYFSENFQGELPSNFLSEILWKITEYAFNIITSSFSPWISLVRQHLISEALGKSVEGRWELRLFQFLSSPLQSQKVRMQIYLTDEEMVEILADEIIFGIKKKSNQICQPAFAPSRRKTTPLQWRLWKLQTCFLIHGYLLQASDQNHCKNKLSAITLHVSFFRWNNCLIWKKVGVDLTLSLSQNKLSRSC